MEAGETGVAVSTAEDCWWHVVEGALFLQRWQASNDEPAGHRLLTAADVQAKTGDRVRVRRGEVVDRVPAQKE